MPRTRHPKLLVVALAAAAAVPVLASDPAPAQADRVRVRVGGNVAFRVGGSVHVKRSPRRYRHRRHVRPYRPYRVYRPYAYVRPRVYWSGGLYVRGRAFAEPPPPTPPCSYECGASVPSYYTPAPPAAAPAVVARPVEEPLPRWAIGVMGGRWEGENGRDADELGLFARYRLTPALAIEVEAAKTEHDAGDRVDKRIGGALYLDLMPRSWLAPYVLGGGGVSHADVGDGAFTADQVYGEVGAGLTWRVTDRLHIAGDVRVGERVSERDDDDIVLQTAVLPPIQDEEQYTSGRLSAILYF